MSASKATPRGAPMPPPVVNREAHAVHFYWNDHSLVEQIVRFIGDAVVDGDAAIVIAMRAHREALAQHLEKRGIRLSKVSVEGRNIALDAAASAVGMSALSASRDTGRGKFSEDISRASFLRKISAPASRNWNANWRKRARKGERWMKAGGNAPKAGGSLSHCSGVRRYSEAARGYRLGTRLNLPAVCC
jgi:hypothetical protein